MIGFVKDRKETACSSRRVRVELELALSAITSGDFLESRSRRAKSRRVEKLGGLALFAGSFVTTLALFAKTVVASSIGLNISDRSI